MKKSRRGNAKARWDGKRLGRETAEFDREFVADTFGKPKGAALERWQRAKRKPGRPRQGAGVKVISVSVEKGLLRRCDALAKRMGVSRAALISHGLQEVLAAKGRAGSARGNSHAADGKV